MSDPFMWLFCLSVIQLFAMLTFGFLWLYERGKRLRR